MGRLGKVLGWIAFIGSIPIGAPSAETPVPAPPGYLAERARVHIDTQNAVYRTHAKEDRNLRLAVHSSGTGYSWQLSDQGATEQLGNALHVIVTWR